MPVYDNEINRILQKRIEDRSWDEVLKLQAEKNRTSDSLLFKRLSDETEKAYEMRYGTEDAKTDAAGRVIDED